MSSRSSQRKPRKASKTKRTAVAQKIGEQFAALNPHDKRQFTDETLTALMNMSPRQLGKLFGKFVKRGRPSTEDLETANQLIVVFLWSVKEEFRYHYATMIFKRFESAGVPFPTDLPEKLEAVRQLDFIHAGVSPEMYQRLFNEYQRMSANNVSFTFDEFFSHLLGDSK
jgi:hypothetical protein